MDISHRLVAAGGIFRSSELIRSGASRREIQQALAIGAVVRPGRGWIALPDTDPQLLFAARYHVVLSGITQAKRLNLWVSQAAATPHVAVPGPGAHVAGPEMVVHWTTPFVPRRPMLLEDTLENTLMHVAECQPQEAALTVWESALNAGSIDMLALHSLPLNERARVLLARCTPFSDSGLESLVCSRLRWLPIPVRQQAHLGGKRIDMLIGARSVVQIDGASHTGPQRTADIRHDAELIQLGYVVIRVSYAQVMHRREEAESLILEVIARGAHLERRR